MKKTQIKKIKEHYIEIKKQIIANLSKTEEIDVAGDEVDKIQADTISNMLEKLSSRDLQKLNKINFALSLPDDKLNECDECGEDISENRLLALPGVRICISCAEEAEKNKKLYA